MAEPRERVDWERVAQVTGMSPSEVERRRKLEERVRSTAAKLRENVAAVEEAARGRVPCGLDDVRRGERRYKDVRWMTRSSCD